MIKAVGEAVAAVNNRLAHVQQVKRWELLPVESATSYGSIRQWRALGDKAFDLTRVAAHEREPPRCQQRRPPGESGKLRRSRAEQVRDTHRVEDPRTGRLRASGILRSASPST